MIADLLLEKSKEAFILAVEIYNKPTIRYRVEGFAFFICNAWELMLKSHLIKTKGEQSIYYKDNPERTINLENCIRLIFTNDKDPLRLNLEKIIELVKGYYIQIEFDFSQKKTVDYILNNISIKEITFDTNIIYKLYLSNQDIINELKNNVINLIILEDTYIEKM